jgi:flagellar hook protein FlgE
MLTSFSTALSALSATTTAIDVVGNNLANLNSTGFKNSVVSFHDLVTQSLGAGLGETQVGFGVGSPITLRQFTQGGLQVTGGPLDAAIQGDGFFVVRDSNGNQLYTRGGNLQVDQQGNLMTATGQQLQGWTDFSGQATPDTNLPVGDIVLPVGTLKSPTVTQNASLDLNLNASGVAGESTGEFSSSMKVYDSLGNPHVLTFAFTKSTTANQWDYSITVPDTDLTAAFTPVTGSLTFDSTGVLTSPTATDAAVQIPITGLADGAADFNVNWSVYNNAVSRITQYSATSAVAANAQDGAPPSALLRVGLSDGGKVVAQYSDGTQRIVGQVAMALIRNPQSLIAMGNSNYALSARTALPAIGLPDTGGRGGVLGGQVEGSTVDIAKEFTNLIVLQRAYQANGKVVTTVDQISQETINLKQ